MKDNKTYCPLAFNTIYSSNSGEYNLCCRAINKNKNNYYKENHILKKYNTKNTSPFQFFLSKEMEDIRKKMLNGEKIDICQNCYDEETNIGYSNRKKYVDKFLKKKKVLPRDVEKVELKLRIFGNYCNLSCVSCHPYNSSTRKKELKDANIDDVFFSNESYGGNSHQQWINTKKDILNNIERVEKLQLTGGEPLLIPHHWEFLMKDISDKHAENIELYYNTNLTSLTYKNYSVYDLINKFKKVNFGVSCDHYNQKLRFMRYPIDVDKFENNLMSLNKYIKNLSCTVQILNIFDLVEIKEYYKKNFGLKLNTQSYVKSPKIMSIRNLPDNIKIELKNKYKKEFDNINSVFLYEFDKSSDIDMLQKGKNYLNSLSHFRKIEWKTLWPEINNL